MSSYNICISACETKEKNGGLYAYTLTDNGKLEKISFLSADEPMFAVTENERLYVILKSAFGNESGIFGVDIHNGLFGKPDKTVSTHGIVSCHLCVCQGEIYTVNYLSGNVVKLPDTVLTHSGCGVHKERQDAPHTHFVTVSPCKKYVLATDLGLDMISVMTRNLEEVSYAGVPKGHGARHLVFSPCGKYLYCANELTASVSVFSWNEKDGILTLIDTVESRVTSEGLSTSGAAAIRISKDASKLYMSDRGENTLDVFEITDGTKIRLVQKIPCGGDHPRDFILTPDEKYLICANMESNSAEVFAMKDGFVGEITHSITLPKPLCVTIPEN